MASRKAPAAYRPIARPLDGREELWAILIHGSQLKLKMGFFDQSDEQLYKRIEKYASKEAAIAESETRIRDGIEAGWVEQPGERMPLPDRG